VSEHEHERLSAYLDGELPPEEMSAVAGHVAACAECAARLAEFAAVDEAAAALAANAPSGYFEALPRRMRGRLEPRRSGARGVPAWTWAVAAALLLAVVTPLTFSRRPRLAPAPEAVKERTAGAPLATAPPATPEAPAADAAPAAPPAPARPSSARPAAPAAEANAVKLQDALPPPAAAPAPAVSASGAAANAAAPPVTEELRKREEGFAPAPADAERKQPEPQARRDKGVPAVGAAGAGAFSRVEPQSAPKRDASEAVDEDSADKQTRQPTAAREQQAVAPAEAPAAGGRIAESLQVDGLASRSVYDEKDAAADQEWRRLVASKPQSVEESRRLREELRRFVDSAPDGPHADAARRRMIEAGYATWRSGGDAADEAVFRRDAAAYLKRGEDAKDKPRVRELLLSR